MEDEEALTVAFTSDITKFIAKTKLSADVVLRKVGLDCYRGVLGRSPVKTGRFRANNRLAVNAPNLQANDETLPTGESAAAVETIGQAKFGDTIYITNNLPYASAIEHGIPGIKYSDGRKAHSPQAPTGVYRNTFDDVKDKLQNAVKKVEDL